MPSPTTRRATPLARLALSAAAAVLLSVLLPLATDSPGAGAAVWAITGPTNTLVKVGTPLTLNSFTVTSGSPASVAISVSPSGAGTLTLSCGSSCAGITYDRGDGVGDARLRITGTRTAVNAALESMRFDPTTLGTANIIATVVDGTLAWDSYNEHLYAFVPGSFNQPTADAAATASSLYGWQGYLATVTSVAENQRIANLVGSSAAFLGGTDSVVEGTWKWKGGPQDGLTFWKSTCGTGATGICLDTGAVNSWATGEPNAGPNEDFLMMSPGGLWNDTTDTSTCCGYVVEYGGVGSFAPPTATASITVVDFDPVVNQIQVAPLTTTSTTEPTPTTTEPVTTTRATTRPVVTTAAPTTTKLPPSTTRVDTTTSRPGSNRATTTRPTSTTTTRATTSTSTSTTTPPTTTTTPTPGPAPGGGEGDDPGGGAAGATAGAAPDGSSDGSDATVVADTTDRTTTDETTTSSTATVPMGAPATPTDGGDAADVTLRLRAAIGDTAAGHRVDFDGRGLPPGVELQGIVRSTPTVIATGTVDADGTFHTEGVLPEGLAPGTHHLELATLDGTALARAAFRIRADGTIADADAALDVVGGPYDPLQHVPDALGALVAATVALAVVSGRESGRKTASNADEDAPSGGSVAGLDVAAEATLAAGHGWGDRHRTWGAPGTAAIDRWASTAPSRMQRRSAHLARAIAEGAYLRAMIGSLWVVLPLSGVVCGAMAWWSGDRALLSPDWRWVTAVIAISTLDGLAGVGAAAVIALGAVIGGHVTDVPSALALAGLVVLLAGPPAVAVATRPIGRLRGRGPGDRWDRAADVVLAAALTALAVRGMAGALSGLRGRVLPIADHADRFAVTVAVAITVRVLLESLANNHWPERRRRCEPPEPPAQTDLQRYLIPCMRGALFLLASYRFIGINWALLTGAILTVGPMVLGLEPKRLGHHPWAHRLVLRRLTKWFVLLVVGTFVSVELGNHIHEPKRLLLVGFVVVMIPGALADVLAAMGHDAEDRDLTWRHRIAGLLAFVIGALFALGYLP